MGLLVLSRKQGQKVRIGPNCTMTVKLICGNRVALAFEAPIELRIVRDELENYPLTPTVKPGDDDGQSGSEI